LVKEGNQVFFLGNNNAGLQNAKKIL